MKRIELTNSDRVVLVSNKDYAFLSRWNWHYHHGYAERNIRPHHTKMEHLLLGTKNVDHRNGDRLDNRRCNLRKSTAVENRRNKKLYRNNSSGFKGVSWSKIANRWQAQISPAGHLGYFSSPRKAAIEYDKAAVKYHGKFAKTNFPVRFPRLPVSFK